MERYFEDVDLGDEIGPLQREVTDNEVVEFTNLSGQGGGKPSRFTSDEQAQKEGLPGAIVPGIMSMSLLSKLLTDWADSADVKLLDVIFRQTIPHNQILKLLKKLLKIVEYQLLVKLNKYALQIKNYMLLEI